MGDYIDSVLRIVWDHKRKRKFKDAEELLLSTISSYPADLSLRTSLADVYVRQGRLKEAETLAGEILDLYPENQDALIVKGSIEYRRRRYNDAEKYFSTAASLGSLYAKYMLAYTHVRNREYDKALSLAQEALNRDPEDVRYVKVKAMALEGRGELDRAMDVYKEVSDKHPDDTYSKTKYLELRTRSLDSEKAAKEMDRMMKVKKNDASILSAKASSLERAGDYMGAAHCFEAALEIEPDNIYFIKSAGFKFRKAGEHEKALEYLKRAFDHSPRDYMVRNALIASYREIGKLEELITFLEEIVANKPSTSFLWGVINKLKREVGESHD
jgi:tetratricopeptide (TPR) repeat protein